MSDRLSEIEGRLAAATPGPWECDGPTASVAYEVVSPGGFGAVGAIVATDAIEEDAELIAHAPADLAALMGFVREVDQITSDREPNLTFADAIVMIRVALKKLAKS